MTGSRVGTLAVRVRLPHALAPRKDALARAIADDLVVAVLDALEARVHARLGASAIVRLRALPIAWRLELDELADAALVARLADELADTLIVEVQALPRRERLRPRDERIAIFEDDAHAAAALLADDADGRGDAWVHGARGDAPAVWRDVIARGGAATLAVVRWLERMERLAPALARVPSAQITAITAAVAPAERPAVLRAASGRVAAPMDDQEDDPFDPVTMPAAAREPAPANATPGAPDRTVRTEREPPARTLRAPSAAHAAAPPRALPVTTPDDTAPTKEIDTQQAGLFYLIGRVLEIDLAEHLWAAGLPEGDVLAHVAAAIADAGYDPAPRWFGGAFDREPVRPEVPAWARDEVNERVMHALGRRLLRFGIETTPARLDASLAEFARGYARGHALAPALASIVERSAAALTTIIAARLGVPPSTELIRSVCARPGRLILDDDRLIVVMSSAHFELAHRRAGLDHDPGRAPWMRRAVTFVFQGCDEL